MRDLTAIGIAVVVAAVGASCATAPAEDGDPRLTFEETGGPDRLAAGGSATCAVHDSSEITCWGEHPIGEDETTTVSAGGAVEEVSYEDSRLCALHSGGSLSCWGTPFRRVEVEELGERSWIPKQLKEREFDEIAVGAAHLCAVEAESRRVVCAGAGRISYLEEGRGDHDQAVAPEGKFRRLVASGTRTCGVTVDRELVCWGRRLPGEPPRGPGPRRFEGTYVSVAASPHTVCGITPRGSVECRGLGTDPGHYEAESDVDQGVPPAGRYRSIALGPAHGCGRTLDGTVRCWGLGEDRELMEGEHDFDQADPIVESASAVDVGEVHSCAAVDGGIRCWGADEPKEATHGHSPAGGQASVPAPVRPGGEGDADDR